MVKAFAYLRTSSATNVEGDSSERQRQAISDWSIRNGYEVVAEYYDAAVSGADPICERAGFTSMMAALNGVRTILVENASRFARDLMVQEIGFNWLRQHHVDLIAVDHPTQFLDDSPAAVAFRQILGVFVQFEKASMVAKLKGARDRKSAQIGKECGGRKPYSELHPEVVMAAKLISGSLRDKARVLATRGYVSRNGRPLHPNVIKRLLNVS